MATRRQIEANRRNAKKSTGPKTRAGKKRSSENATRHGLNRQPDYAEIEGLYFAIGEDEGMDGLSLLDDRKARTAWALAEKEARLAKLRAIEAEMWSGFAEDREDRQPKLPPDADAREVIAFLNEHKGYTIRPDKLSTHGMKMLLPNLRRMAAYQPEPLRPDLMRRYRLEAEAEREGALQDWFEVQHAEHTAIDQWGDAVYEDVVEEQGKK